MHICLEHRAKADKLFRKTFYKWEKELEKQLLEYFGRAKAVTIEIYLDIVDDIFRVEFCQRSNGADVNLKDVTSSHVQLKALHAYLRNPLWVAAKILQKPEIGEYLKNTSATSSLYGSALLFLLSLSFEGSFFVANVCSGPSEDEKEWLQWFREKEKGFFEGISSE